MANPEVCPPERAQHFRPPAVRAMRFVLQSTHTALHTGLLTLAVCVIHRHTPRRVSHQVSYWVPVKGGRLTNSVVSYRKGNTSESLDQARSASVVVWSLKPSTRKQSQKLFSLHPLSKAKVYAVYILYTYTHTHKIIEKKESLRKKRIIEEKRIISRFPTK